MGGGALVLGLLPLASVASAQTQLTVDTYITVTDAPDPVEAGQSVTYTLAYGNNGPDDAAAPVVVFNPPSGQTLVSVTASSGTCDDSDPVQIDCTVAALASGGSGTITVVVQFSASAALGDYGVTAFISDGDENEQDLRTDTVPGNNLVNETTTVIAPTTTTSTTTSTTTTTTTTTVPTSTSAVPTTVAPTTTNAGGAVPGLPATGSSGRLGLIAVALVALGGVALATTRRNGRPLA